MADILRVRPRSKHMLTTTFVLSCSGLLAGCSLLFANVATAKKDMRTVESVAGFTRMASTGKYLVVVNVLPGEEMYTATEVAQRRPAKGEMTYGAKGRPTGPQVRHVEAHIYDRLTGLPLLEPRPVITVTDKQTGNRVTVPSKLMADVNIGKNDIHFGDNVLLPGNRDITVQVTLNDLEVSVDGHLD